jgi:DNA-binding response OmpR family regulator
VKRPKVLVVDDDPGMREVLESILVTENVEICSAVDGKDAVQKTLALNPDLILLDIGMPKLNGLTFCKAVRAGTQTRKIPIIIVTSLTARGRLEECMEAGADDFVGKPFQVEDLLIRVRAMLKTADVSDHVERINEYILAVHDMHARSDSCIREHAAGGVKPRATPGVQS